MQQLSVPLIIVKVLCAALFLVLYLPLNSYLIRFYILSLFYLLLIGLLDVRTCIYTCIKRINFMTYKLRVGCWLTLYATYIYDKLCSITSALRYDYSRGQSRNDAMQFYTFVYIANNVYYQAIILNLIINLIKHAIFIEFEFKLTYQILM